MAMNGSCDSSDRLWHPSTGIIFAGDKSAAMNAENKTWNKSQAIVFGTTTSSNGLLVRSRSSSSIKRGYRSLPVPLASCLSSRGDSIVTFPSTGHYRLSSSLATAAISPYGQDASSALCGPAVSDNTPGKPGQTSQRSLKRQRVAPSEGLPCPPVQQLPLGAVTTVTVEKEAQEVQEAKSVSSVRTENLGYVRERRRSINMAARSASRSSRDSDVQGADMAASPNVAGRWETVDTNGFLENLLARAAHLNTHALGKPDPLRQSATCAPNQDVSAAGMQSASISEFTRPYTTPDYLGKSQETTCGYVRPPRLTSSAAARENIRLPSMNRHESKTKYNHSTKLVGSRVAKRRTPPSSRSVGFVRRSRTSMSGKVRARASGHHATSERRKYPSWFEKRERTTYAVSSPDLDSFMDKYSNVQIAARHVYVILDDLAFFYKEQDQEKSQYWAERSLKARRNLRLFSGVAHNVRSALRLKVSSMVEAKYEISRRWARKYAAIPRVLEGTLNHSRDLFDIHGWYEELSREPATEKQELLDDQILARLALLRKNSEDLRHDKLLRAPDIGLCWLPYTRWLLSSKATLVEREHFRRTRILSLWSRTKLFPLRNEANKWFRFTGDLNTRMRRLPRNQWREKFEAWNMAKIYTIHEKLSNLLRSLLTTGNLIEGYELAVLQRAAREHVEGTLIEREPAINAWYTEYIAYLKGETTLERKRLTRHPFVRPLVAAQVAIPHTTHRLLRSSHAPVHVVSEEEVEANSSSTNKLPKSKMQDAIYSGQAVVQLISSVPTEMHPLQRHAPENQQPPNSLAATCTGSLPLSREGIVEPMTPNTQPPSPSKARYEPSELQLNTSAPVTPAFQKDSLTLIAEPTSCSIVEGSPLLQPRTPQKIPKTVRILEGLRKALEVHSGPQDSVISKSGFPTRIQDQKSSRIALILQKGEPVVRGYSKDDASPRYSLTGKLEPSSRFVLTENLRGALQNATFEKVRAQSTTTTERMSPRGVRVPTDEYRDLQIVETSKMIRNQRPPNSFPLNKRLPGALMDLRLQRSTAQVMTFSTLTRPYQPCVDDCEQDDGGIDTMELSVGLSPISGPVCHVDPLLGSSISQSLDQSVRMATLSVKTANLLRVTGLNKESANSEPAEQPFCIPLSSDAKDAYESISSAATEANEEYDQAQPTTQATDADGGDISTSSKHVSQDIDEPSKSEQGFAGECQILAETGTRMESSQKPLSYSIPKSALQEAIASMSTPNPSLWSYNLYKNSAGQRPSRHYCKTLEQSERVAQLFIGKDVIGFDLEWKPQVRGGRMSIKENVSMVQMACEDHVALFHLALHRGETAEEIMPPSIKRIMESSNTMKLGVGIGADCTRLENNFGIQSRSLFELSHLHKLVEHAEANPELVNRKLVRLAYLVREHLLLPLAKDDHVRSSDWSKPLNMEQIEYAASDAYAAIVLFNVLDAKRRAMKPMPPLPHFAELKLPIRLARTDNGPYMEKTSDDAELVAEDEQQFTIRASSESGTVAAGEDYLDEIDSIVNPAFQHLSVHPSSSTAVSTAISKNPKHNRSPPRNQSSDVAAATQLILANSWISDFRESSAQRQASPCANQAHLRAYALWHHQALEVSYIAKLLRTPKPLQKSTVAQYILEAIRQDKLPFDDSRIDAVFQYLTDGFATMRYSSLRRTKR